MSARECVVAARRLELSYGSLKALDEVSLHLRRGEILGVVGPNGAGKTTLLRVLGGLLRPDRGSVELRGKQVDGEPPWKIARAGVACSFQSVRLFNRLSVGENLAMASRIPGEENPVRALYRHGARELPDLAGVSAQRQLERMNAAQVSRQAAGSLSFGQRKLVSLALLLSTGCETLLLDEPVGGLSPAAIRLVVTALREEAVIGRSFLLIEHDLPVVWEVCDRVLVMAKGKIRLEGSPVELDRNSVLELFAH